MLNPAARSFESTASSSSPHYYFPGPPHHYLHGLLPLCSPPPPLPYYAASPLPFSSTYYYLSPTLPTPTPPHHYYYSPSPPPPPPPLAASLCNRTSPSQVKAGEGERGRSLSRTAGGSTEKRSASPVFTTRAPTSGACKPPPMRRAPTSVSKSDSFTTVMVRNIPNRISRAMMIHLLDDHCARMNKTARADGAVLSEFDFLYLPMDFRNRCNLGYAFVNFTTAEAASRLCKFLNRCQWKVFDSKKVIDVCRARIQGKSALVNRFKDSVFYCETDDFLPAVFSPPRDGTTTFPVPKVIGRLTRLHRR